MESEEDLEEYKPNFYKGMLIWMMTNRAKYFWTKAFFQVISFSFLVVTLILVASNLESHYWDKVLNLLIFKHLFDFMGYTFDLFAFASRNLDFLKYKYILDFISYLFSMVVIATFGFSFVPEIIEE